MPVITAISVQEKNKERCNIFVDGNFFAGVSMETVLKYRLKPNTEVDAEKLNEILSSAERTQAIAKAADYCAKSLKTKKQVKEYLIRRGYSEETVWYCVDKLKEYGYIDDKEYSKRFIESTSKTQGKRLIEYKLMMKGVKKEDIEAAYSSVDIDEEENAKTVAEKYLKNKELTKENVYKAYKHLIGRGFGYEAAKSAVSHFKEEDL